MDEAARLRAQALEQAASSRLRLEVKEPSAVDEAALAALGVRGLVWPAPKVAHLIWGPGAEALADSLGGGAG